MVDPMDNPNAGDDLQLPAAMKAQLRSAYAPRPGQPSATEWSRIDATIQSQSASHFTTPSPMASPRAVGVMTRPSTPTVRQPSPSVLFAPSRWRIAAGLATAAMVGIVLWISTSGDGQRNESPSMTSIDSYPTKPQPGDINRDGRLDILDAYLLQRRIETAAKIESQWDLTRDGQVDQRDVQAIAAESVKLDGGPRL